MRVLPGSNTTTYLSKLVAMLVTQFSNNFAKSRLDPKLDVKITEYDTEKRPFIKKANTRKVTTFIPGTERNILI